MSNEVYRQVSIETFDQKFMINAMTCSMLESTPTSDYYDMEDDIYKSIVL